MRHGLSILFRVNQESDQQSVVEDELSGQDSGRAYQQAGLAYFRSHLSQPRPLR